MTTAGEALNPEVYRQFEKATGLQIIEGFGQSETTMVIGNLRGAPHKIGSMGKPAPIYKVSLVDANGEPVPDGEVGEIVIDVSEGAPCGLFTGYYGDVEKTKEVWHDGFYHTGDSSRGAMRTASIWYVGRVDDVIKSSGIPHRTVRDRQALSWSCPMCLNAESPQPPTRCAVRSSRRASY